MADETLSDFIDHLDAWLARFPSGGSDFAWNVRTFASFNRSGLMGIKAAIRRANDQQKKSIGSGMAYAAVACLARDPETARQIADVVQRSGDRLVVEGYLQSSDDSPALPKSARGLGEVGTKKTVGVGRDIGAPEMDYRSNLATP